jgi:hypothetical protein
MARKSPATTADLNALHSKFAKALNAALDGEADSEGVVQNPTASMLSVVRAFLSDSKIAPAISGDDQLERMRATYSSLPFTDTTEDGIPTTTNEKAKH